MGHTIVGEVVGAKVGKVDGCGVTVGKGVGGNTVVGAKDVVGEKVGGGDGESDG